MSCGLWHRRGTGHISWVLRGTDSVIIALNTAVIQRQQQMITDLEQRLAKLEAKAD